MLKKDHLLCPHCKLDNVVRKKKAGYTIMLSILLIGLPLPFFRKSYYCFDCNNEWKENKKRPTTRGVANVG